jgi:hypothetical protein
MRPIMNEAEYAALLDVISKEVEGLFVAFHTFEKINDLALKDPAVLDVLNADAQFWNAHTAATQAMIFMTFSRLFDKTPNVITFRSLLTATIGNIDLFSHEALGARKLEHGRKPEWWEGYMAHAWIPREPRDLRFLSKEFAPHEAHVHEIYLPLRHAIYAHRLMSEEQAGRDLFTKTNRQQLGKTILFLYQLFRAIQDLYRDGIKPEIDPESHRAGRELDLIAIHAQGIGITVENLLRKLTRN